MTWTSAAGSWCFGERAILFPIHSTSICVQVSASAPGAPDPLAGQMSEELIAEMKQKITAALSAETVNVVDVYGDGRHVSIDVVASSFEGLTSVKRQQAVYKAIWLELQNTVHAVDAMTTKTPGEVAAKSS